MSKHTAPASPSLPFHQIDLRDWLMWVDAARELGIAAGREHRCYMTIITEALTWHALHARMLAAGLHELHDEAIFRAAKTMYLQTECETRRSARREAQG